MSSQKTNKSFSKRLKITSTGKILSRKAGFNHFNAKQRRSKQLSGKVPMRILLTPKVLQQNLPHHNATPHRPKNSSSDGLALIRPN